VRNADYDFVTFTKVLINKQTIVDAIDESGRTALFEISKLEDSEVAKKVLIALLDAGISITATDFQGRTVLHELCAVAEGANRRIIDAVISASLSSNDTRHLVTIKDLNGNLAQHFAHTPGAILALANKQLADYYTKNEAQQTSVDAVYAGRDLLAQMLSSQVNVAQSTTITFINDTTENITLVLEARQGKFLTYKELVAGDSFTQYTFANCKWFVHNLYDQPLGFIIAAEEPIEFRVSKLHNDRAQIINGAIESKKCTFTVTKKDFYKQNYYYCLTCDPAKQQGICVACKEKCHEGHDIVEEPIVDSYFYCDCGAGALSVECKCCKDTDAQ